MNHRTRRTLRTGSFVLACLLAAPAASADTWVYVREGTALSYLQGHQTPAPAWTALSFSESSAWTASASGFGIGYGDGDDNTVLDDMRDGYLTVYVRSHFQVGPELAQVKNLRLEASYDDGFVAYLNGTEVGRANMPAGATTADTAASSHEVSDGTAMFDVASSLLVQGDNVLAVEVHNTSLGSSDLSFIPTLLADDGTPPVDATISRGPFLQQVGRRSALVVWETAEPAPSRVSYGPTPSMSESVESGDLVRHHVVELTDLQPATTYYFQVQSATIPSPTGELVTEVDRAMPYRLVAFGDTRSNHDDHRAVIEAMVVDRPLAYFHGGDLVGNGASDTDWDRFFEVEQAMLIRAPLYPALGNHEGDGPQFADIFELPDNSPSPERYYTVRYANTLFVSLDLYTNPFGVSSDQYAWLETVLANAAADPDIRQRFVQLHHGPYDSGSHKSNTAVRTYLVPLFEQYGVDIVFSGHDHCYERSTVNGVKYVVTGGGGAPLYGVDGDWWTEVSDSVLHYCVLDIEGARTVFTAKRLDGSTLDSFVIGQDAGECTSPSDCEGRQHGACDAEEAGAWACVQTACIWNCEQESPPPPPPDGGTGGSGGTSGTGGSAGSGGAVVNPDAGTPDGSSGAPGATPARLPQDESSGCACRQATGSRGMPPALAALLLGAAAWLRRRRT